MYVCLLSHHSWLISLMECSTQDSRNFILSTTNGRKDGSMKQMEILQSVWARYRPVVPLASKLPVLPVAAPVTTSLCPKKSRVNFVIFLDYGHQVHSGPDTLEEYLRVPPLPHLMDPLGYWLKQQKAGEAMGDASNTALAQMALDYLSVPGSFFGFSFTQAACVLFLISFFIS